jgi:lipoyl(octanoyl) transferase
MPVESPASVASVAADAALQVYLLGSVDFDTALALQRRLVFEVSGNRNSAALILCEHPPLITVGRHGSWAHILCGSEERRARRWSVRWVNRGGGCLLHLPGQLAIYPILALDRLGLSLETYVQQLQNTLIAILRNFTVAAATKLGFSQVWAGSRPVAEIGVAVRDWVTYYGAALNINPDLEPFRRVRLTDGESNGHMTSLERERRGPVRTSLVREGLVEHFAAQFAFSRVSLFFDHPSLCRKAPADAVPAGS